jgi:hypothetical protein
MRFFSGKTMRSLALAAAALTLAATSAKANNIPGVNNTGANSQTCGASDSSWSVLGGSAFVLSPSCANWFGSFAADTSTSAWIGASTTNPTPATPYSFTETFSMAGLNTSTAVISGLWYIDDTGTLSINGTVIDTQTRTWNGVAFTIPDSDLNAGTNTISVTMTSDDGIDDGARVVFTTATASPVGTSAAPEPSSLLLLGSGIFGLGSLLRRKFASSIG